MKEQYFDFNAQPGKKLKDRKIINTGKPLISVITPYYNAEKFIEQTAISILNQTFPYWEWIIVNDGSTNENTSEVLNKIASLDDRIKIFNKENGGPAKARYYGAQHAISDIIFTLDADDLIDNTMLECGYLTLYTNKDATWAYSSIATFGDENYLYNLLFDTFKEKKENLIAVASFIRKEAFLELKEYCNLPKEVHEDWYMWLSFLAKGYKPVKMNFYGFWYRRMNTGRLGTINSNKEKTKIAEKYLDKVRKKVNKRVGAIQFPSSCRYDFSSYPVPIDIGKPPINIKGEKKRILFLFPWTVVGGADIFNLNLIKALKDNGYEITIVTTEVRGYEQRQNFEKIVDEYFDLTTFLKREEWAGFLDYLLRTRNIDIVFESNSFYGYYVIPWLKSRYPKTIFVDYLHAEDWSWRDGSYPRESVAISKFLDKTYTCTKHLKNLMFEKMSRKEENVDVVYIGTDEKYFDPSINFAEEEELRKKYEGRKVILFPTRIVYLKRPLFMVSIIKELVKTNKDIVCVVVGDGPVLELMKEKVKEYELESFFDFVGLKLDLRVYYKLADVTIICSLTEGLTLTAYESLAMGAPVISSDVGGQKELIDDTCGKIIPKFQSVEKDLMNFNYDKKEIKLYVEAIKDILYNKEYEKMKKVCRKKIVGDFSSTSMINKLVGSLDNMIKDGSKVNPNLCLNEELAQRYLILFNEYNKPSFFNPDEQSSNNKLVNKLWKYRAYRGIIKVLQKTGIIKFLKKFREKIK